MIVLEHEFIVKATFCKIMSWMDVEYFKLLQRNDPINIVAKRWQTYCTYCFLTTLKLL